MRVLSNIKRVIRSLTNARASFKRPVQLDKGDPSRDGNSTPGSAAAPQTNATTTPSGQHVRLDTRPACFSALAHDRCLRGTKAAVGQGACGVREDDPRARVVEHLSSILETPVAYFFFSSDLESREYPFLAIRSWISQIVSRHEGAFEHVRERWESDPDPVATRATVITLFTQLLHVIPGCTFVADGLDECTHLDNSSTSVAKFLHDVTDAIAETNARVLFVSRDEPEIRHALIDDARESFAEYEIMPEDVRSDTAAYSRSIHAIANTPTGLDHLYDHNWTGVTRLGDWETHRAFALLRWTAFALRPLTVCEITEAVLIVESEDLPLEDLPDAVDDD
ncbi:hypothetical protein B0J13DRAFT_682076 [Dactylonectria estremocensis]|uniref:Nephrocystin 3-like N-terminal domain-containing protein n=1 Tax=Dactylonectria estremocensis TaxID=1079267 RepID=A0A9P9I9C8_9HYPO|nr:hypothetical protein B0J13DRAFT_682076 [Dactylonectria estremocensis]